MVQYSTWCFVFFGCASFKSSGQVFLSPPGPKSFRKPKVWRPSNREGEILRKQTPVRKNNSNYSLGKRFQCPSQPVPSLKKCGGFMSRKPTPNLAWTYLVNDSFLSQWLSFKVWRITDLVGKMKFKLLFQGPLVEWDSVIFNAVNAHVVDVSVTIQGTVFNDGTSSTLAWFGWWWGWFLMPNMLI